MDKKKDDFKRNIEIKEKDEVVIMTDTSTQVYNMNYTEFNKLVKNTKDYITALQDKVKETQQEIDKQLLKLKDLKIHQKKLLKIEKAKDEALIKKANENK